MKRKGLLSKLIKMFCMSSLFPILVLCFFSYYSNAKLIRDNAASSAESGVKQLNENLTLSMQSYEELLYQAYTNDDVVAWVDAIDEGVDDAVATNQLRRFIHGLIGSRDYIQSVTVITPGGSVITYDTMTMATYETSWMKNYSMNMEEIYEEVDRDYKFHFLPTEYSSTFANKDNYLFHIGHRIVDYRSLDRDCGIVIISVDQRLLQGILASFDVEGEVSTAVLDGDGRVLSGSNESSIGDYVLSGDRDSETRLYRKMTGDDREQVSLTVTEASNELTGWKVLHMNNRQRRLNEIRRQSTITVSAGLVLFLLAILTSARISGDLIGSAQVIAGSMKKARTDLDAGHAEINPRMPDEIVTIAEEYNFLLDELKQANLAQREADLKQRKAQMQMMESQINPHFLYNTLDTINWMAIDKDAFDISNAITSLARILRYAISDSGKEVSLAEETEWLKRYIYLQQFRLKEPLQCTVDVDPDIQDALIHKMLMQPFAENAILHGFTDGKELHILKVILEKAEDKIRIRIIDNGSGMPAEMVESMNNQTFDYNIQDGHRHIGTMNALLRLRMYYGEESSITVTSEMGVGTEIQIFIPYKKEIV